MVGTFIDTEPLQQLRGPLSGVPAWSAQQEGRQLHVLDRAQLVDQVERLEHEADAPAPEDSPLRLRQLVHALSCQVQLALVGVIEPAQQV
jgi:hypothetical protein